MGNRPGRKLEDLTGRKFGEWTVEGLAHKNSSGKWLWKLVCSCGAESSATGSKLRRGDTRRCARCASLARHFIRKLGEGEEE